MTYLTIKALHIIAVIAWMAGLLYLPRLFVYHAEAKKGSEQSETFKVMERRLLRAIMNPAMIAVWVFGIWLTYDAKVYLDGWFHAKFLLVCILSYMHHLMGRWRKDFEADRNERPARYFRIANEVPTVIMIAIVLLVVLRPF
jgi:putative membrane protein